MPIVDSIGTNEFGLMIQGAASAIRLARDSLSKLDSATGDGDHGVTMVRVMDRLERVAAEGQAKDLHCLLEDSASTLFSIDGGAAGLLLGFFFQGLAVATNYAWDVHGLAAAFESGLRQVQKQTLAQIGDKTLIDALIPAVQALRRAADEGVTITEALHQGAAAAVIGAVSSADFVARFGRAKYLGEQTMGYQDPGATSIALILQGFYDRVKNG